MNGINSQTGLCYILFDLCSGESAFIGKCRMPPFVYDTNGCQFESSSKALAQGGDLKLKGCCWDVATFSKSPFYCSHNSL